MSSAHTHAKNSARYTDNDEYDYLFQNKKTAKTLVIELDNRNFIKRKRKDHPAILIDQMNITDSIKEEAKKYYQKYLEDLEISDKNPSACVFWSIYVASRKLNVPVNLDTICRISGVGLEKYDSEIRANPLNYGVKTSHKVITTLLVYFSTLVPKVDMTPSPIEDFLESIVDEQELAEHKNYIFDFLTTLLEDDFWTDQNPNMLSYAILIFLSNQKNSPFYGKTINVPVYLSKNIIIDLINKLKSEVFEFL